MPLAGALLNHITRFLHPNNIWEWIILVVFFTLLVIFFHRAARWLWRVLGLPPLKKPDVVRRVQEWMSSHHPFRREPADRRPAPSATSGTRVNPVDRPRGAKTSKIVWVLLALSLLGNTVVVPYVWKLSYERRMTDFAHLRRIMTLELQVRSAFTTGMFAEPRQTGDLATRLDQDFGEIERRLKAIEEEPALELTSSETDFLYGNDWKLGRMIVLASLTDTDQDGTMDAYDEWPTIPRDRDVPDSDINGGRDRVYWSDGKPAADTDGDDINDVVDRCPAEAGSNYELYTVGGIPQAEQLIDQIEIQFYGCPDSDKDWIPDAVDVCPTKKADNYEEDDQNLDGCPDEEQNFSQGGVVDYRYVTEKPAYGDSSGKLVGRFTAERTVGDVVIEFLIACEAMGADGAQLPGDTTDYNLVKKWGVCRPVGNV